MFFQAVFLQNYSNVYTESILTCFREFEFLAQIAYFAKAIAVLYSYFFCFFELSPYIRSPICYFMKFAGCLIGVKKNI